MNVSHKRFTGFYRWHEWFVLMMNLGAGEAFWALCEYHFSKNKPWSASYPYPTETQFMILDLFMEQRRRLWRNDPIGAVLYGPIPSGPGCVRDFGFLFYGNETPLWKQPTKRLTIFIEEVIEDVAKTHAEMLQDTPLGELAAKIGKADASKWRERLCKALDA